MNQRAPWFFGFMTVVMAAFMARGVLPPVKSDPVESTAPAKEDDKKKDEDAAKKKRDEEKGWIDFCPPLCLYQEFFGIPLSPASETLEKAAGRITDGAAHQSYSLEFLVALVPDPVDSNLSYRFDEALDAVQRGLAQSGYLLDRVSLPWAGETATTRLYRGLPGSLLFRRSDADGRHLLTVFLVGESPKGGIQKRAFYNALDLVTGLQKAQGKAGPLRILGPSFSGSAESLRIALGEWLLHHRPFGAEGLNIQIVAGSATARGLENLFPQQFYGAGMSFRFARTILDDDTLQEKTFKILHEQLGWELKEIVLLTEFDTFYGSKAVQRSKGKTGGRWVPRFVQFPSNLAHLRTAREKLGLDKDQSPASSPVATARKSLNLSLADEDNPIDVVPQLNELSTQANDLALASLLHTLSRQGVRYIGILATDIQDRLFLAEQIRIFCPDAVVFTFDNHLLDAHPDVAKSMDGTLVLTSFPLYPAAAEEQEAGVLRQFTSEFQQGIYRAAVQLVSGKEPPAPGAWVSAVGNGELWPIAVAPGTKIPPFLGGDKAEIKWLVSVLVIALLAAWIWRLTLPLQLAVVQSWSERIWERGALFLPALGAGVLWLASGVLLVFYALPLWDPLLKWRSGPWRSSLLPLAVAYFGMAVVFARLVRPPRRRRGWIAWIGVCAFGIALLGWVMKKLWVFPEGAYFFYQRAGDFSSGLSPLVSLAFLGAAMYAWAVLELKRRRLIVAQDLSWPLRGSRDPALASCRRKAETLREVLLKSSPGPVFWAVVAFFVLLAAPRLLRGIQPIAETRGYGMVFVGAVLIVFILSTFSFHRFFLAWRGLEDILDRLCNTWVQPVLGGASDLLDWHPMKSFGLRMPTLKMTLVSVQQLRKVSRLNLLGPAGAAVIGSGGSRGAMDDDLDRVFVAEQSGNFLAEVEARRYLRSWFDGIAALLEQVRWASGALEPVPTDPEGKLVLGPREIEMRELEIYLAVRVVAYLRYVFAHLRYALLAATGCGLALLFAVSTYAFQPKRFLSFGIWMALLAGSLMTLRVFVQMDRNGALSAISGTDAGKVTLDRTFYTNLLTYGGIPVLGIVLTQFPSVGRLFGDWLNPLLRILGAG